MVIYQHKGIPKEMFPWCCWPCRPKMVHKWGGGGYVAASMFNDLHLRQTNFTDVCVYEVSIYHSYNIDFTQLDIYSGITPQHVSLAINLDCSSSRVMLCRDLLHHMGKNDIESHFVYVQCMNFSIVCFIFKHKQTSLFCSICKRLKPT